MATYPPSGTSSMSRGCALGSNYPRGPPPLITPSSEAALRELRTSRCLQPRPRSHPDAPDLRKMHILHAAAIIIFPPLLFWTVLGFCSGQDWDTPDFRDKLERPNWRIYTFLMVTNICAMFTYRRSPEKLKRSIFIVHALVTVVIRCLSSLSGMMSLTSWYCLVYNSNSVGKGVWLGLFLGPLFWNWTYLGRYEDFRYNEDTKTLYDKSDAIVWTFAPTIQEANLNSHTYFPWKDTIVRLSYIHIIDNLIHIIWLRFYLDNGPYTSYINNSEILTAVLLIEMAVYTYARIKSHVVFEFEDDEKSFMTLEKKVPVATKSVSKGLIGQRSDGPPSQHPPSYWFGYFVFLCFVAACVIISLVTDIPIFMFL
ncbi:hypothetical protein K504DRAFT_465298 [Pleomassaria siparia CBS 279.74]|uniref:Uncharacterized protein n=1 Tax=Pleomassaria siparia CBS 279.74 TaxID=1314801 RepID=A0A6G1KFD1_9PLEO|nr:hypothetical protein K504DRAFT_465298 [Pleomassaria siparia CBS 279.74]